MSEASQVGVHVTARTFSRCMTSPLALAALAALALMPAQAAAQDAEGTPAEDVANLNASLPAERDPITFEADQAEYDSEADRVVARGNVILRSERASVRADEVTWDRTTGTIVARGAVRFVDDTGNQIFTETIELTDEFEAGSMDELLLALRAGGRLAARSAERQIHPRPHG